MSPRTLIWDVPTRIFHWLLVISFAGAFLTAESERYREIHVTLGYTLLGLLMFRLIWGVVGSRYAQFRSFLFKPSEIIEYVISMFKSKAEHFVGHNPAGSVSVYLLLALGLTCGISGVVIFQDIGGDALEELHELAANSMLAVVALHIIGVLVSSVMHRENLVRSMVTGLKSAPPIAGIHRARARLGVIMLVLVVAFWIGYPAMNSTPPNMNVSQTEQPRVNN